MLPPPTTRVGALVYFLPFRRLSVSIAVKYITVYSGHFCIPLLLGCIQKVFPCLKNQAVLEKCIFRTPLKIIMQNPCVQVE